MRTPSIRTRVTAALLLLVTMALLEATFVVYVQRESERAAGNAARTSAILLQQAAAGRALVAMQASQRGFLITRDASELEAYARQERLFDVSVVMIQSLIVDSQQRATFAQLLAQITGWRTISRELIDLRARGEDVTDRLMLEAIPRFNAAMEEFETLERRQVGLSDEASALARGRVRAATIALTLIPLVAVVVLLGLLAATARTILGPLAALAASAQRLAGGDYDAAIPAMRDDEIGVLVRAFSDMRHAVQEREAEAALGQQRIRAAHTELLAIINIVPAALVIVDPDGSIRLQNRAAEHLLGTLPDTPSARKAYWQGFDLRDATGKPMRIRDLPPVRALSGIEVIGEEIDIRRPDGRAAIVLVGAAPLRDAQGRITGAVAGFHDITRLRELDRMKDEFVAIVSHELRTPLTAIRGSLQLLLADDAVSDPDNRQLLSVALTSCERLVRIINDMLDISKIEAGQLRLRTAALPAEALVRHAVEGVQTVARQAGIELAVDLAADLPEISGDHDRLTQALVNLLSNAVKFAPRGTTVTVSARETPDAVAFSVADRGPGIAPDDITRLFRKFQQLDDVGTRRAGGTGLGLSITKAIVEEHGGTIAVDSVVGQGTTFTFTIPRAAHPAQPAAALMPPSTPPAGATRTVLIVDDDDTSRAALARAMRAAGFRVVEASRGADVVEIARREAPDAITLALDTRSGEARSTMNALSGDPATREIPLVVAMDDAREGALEAAEKPFDVTDLVARVKRVLHGRVHATILVADDDADLRLVLRETLGRHGFSVIEAADGREALDVAAREALDLVLLDLRMPHVHGHDVIRALRKNEATARLPIIVLSGSWGARRSLESLVLGANMFLAKPAEPDALVREIDRLLRQPAS